MASRPACPSCHTRVTPLALECPVCGLPLTRRALPRPLLFQASALAAGATPKEERQSISTPAIGRVEPLTVEEPPAEALASPEPALPAEVPPPPPIDADLFDSFWPVVRMEALDAAALLCLNALLAGVATLQVGLAPGVAYGALWPWLVPLHLATSWAYVMVPMVLVGQSPMMASQRLLLDTDQPERRIAFSCLHLVSVLCLPISFLCMVLTPDHRTLAELLSGMEILQMPYPRLR